MNIWRRGLALVLALTLCLSLPVFAQEQTTSVQQTQTAAAGQDKSPELPPDDLDPTPTDPEPTDPEPTDPEPVDPEPTDQELMEAYQIPDNWAKDALLFAVRSGLMQGDANSNIRATGTATRAEVATILARVLKTQTQADISGYTDAKPGSWYYNDMAKAVAVGIFTGTGDGKLQPDANITREQCFVVIARAFGITGGTVEDTTAYWDWHSISGWAVEGMASLVKAGVVNGSGGKLNPQGIITRQELAAVLYRLTTALDTQVPQSFTGKLVAATDTVAPGTVINGDLLLSSEAQELCLTEVQITGRLVIQGCGQVKLTLTGCNVGQLVVCRPAEIAVDGGVGEIVVMKDATVSGTVNTLTLRASALFASGTAGQVAVYAGSFTLGESAAAESIMVNYTDKGKTLTVNGAAGTVTIGAKDMTVNGTGTAQVLQLQKEGSSVSLQAGSTQTNIDQGLSGLTAQRTDTNMPGQGTEKANITATFGNVSGTRKCRLIWYLNGSVVGYNSQFSLSGGAFNTCPMDFTSYINKNWDTVDVRLVVQYEDESRSFAFTVTLNTIYPQALKVRTEDVTAKLKTATGLYKSHNSQSLTGYITTVAAGTTVVYETYYGTAFARIRLSNGTVGWVKYSTLSISGAKFTVDWDYSTAVKECWVNRVRCASSSNSYLIWVSLYTQKVNIFKGSKGNWKLIRTCPCATGKNTKPTLVQTTTIRYKTAKWNFNGFYCHHVSVIDGDGRAFHSLPYKYTGGIYDSTIGRVVSSGCIRMYDADCIYIYNNIPTGTAVVVY